MKADDMNKCSMITAFHQMTNARSDRWHNFAGDPLFGKIAEGKCQNSDQHSGASENQPRLTVLSRSLKDHIRRYLK